jgi:hypothetical protein
MAFHTAKTSQVLGSDGLELSSREQEILGWVYRGKTNLDIAAVLDGGSPFPVRQASGTVRRPCHVPIFLKPLCMDLRS